ncbi:recombinase family protein [Chitinivibrio alkaliphilus]|uniref:Resolvase and Invertase subfamily protein n=1 Tax=Chitinivibrio alkaliphilus ACht1 TaxID=1313304 RepID=U7D9A5_9BACT|nr:recombinase family protein [Chitinivibrio alkaliphilus]ERP30985.1 resolvase and Invertase subfamily protein [Chitinivibrio alkaliphilus ACht1]
MANVGYMRVSTTDQDMSLQRDALQEYDCVRIFSDKISGSRSERPGLTDCLAYLRPGDVLVVWRLDRLGRSLKDLIERVTKLEGKDVHLCSITEQIDTTKAGGKLVFHLFGAMAEFERNLISERTKAGLAAARKRGRKGGRPRKLTDDQVAAMRNLWQGKEHSLAEIGAMFGVSKWTVRKWVVGE